MRRLLLLALLFLPATAEEVELMFPYTFEHQGITVKLINTEVTRDRKYLLVHARLRHREREPIRYDWASTVVLETADQGTLSTNWDALVDSGGGMVRTSGPFLVPRNKEVGLTIPFALAQGELPARVRAADGALSKPIDR